MKQFNETTDKLLIKLFRNLPTIILISVLVFRLLIAIPITIVAVNKFDFIENSLLKNILAFGSIISLEVLLTIFSLLTAYFRRNNFDSWGNSILGLVLVLTGYTSYLIQNISGMYDDILYPVSAFLTLHLLNVVSIVLSESVGFLLKQDNQDNSKPLQDKKNSEVVYPIRLIEIREAPIDLDDKIRRINESGFFSKQFEIAEFLGTNASKVSRVLNN
jgi:hypothetical protein